MTHHAETLAGLVSHIRTVDPWKTFPPTSYLDAQAILLWMRLGVFPEAIELLEQPSEYAVRWQVEAVVKREVYGIAQDRGWFTESQLDTYLDNPNIHLNPPAPRDSAHNQDVTRLRRWIADLELQRDRNAAQDERRHLGEADTITAIRRVEPGSVFVTGDVGAFEVAQQVEGVVPIKGLAFVAALITNETFTFEEIWRRLCDTRTCTENRKTTCHVELSCPLLSLAAAKDGVLSQRFRDGNILIEEMASDFGELVTGLELVT